MLIGCCVHEKERQMCFPAVQDETLQQLNIQHGRPGSGSFFVLSFSLFYDQES